MSIEQILGTGFLAIGLWCLSSYIDNLAVFRMNWFYRELQPMQDRWGKTAGTVLHFVEYVIAPVGFGVMFLAGMVVFH